MRSDNKAAVALGREAVTVRSISSVSCTASSTSLTLSAGARASANLKKSRVAGISGPEMQAEQRRTNEPIKLIRKLRCIRLEAQAKPVWMLGVTVVAD